MNADRPTLEAQFRELDLEHERSKVALGIAQNNFAVAGDKCHLIWENIVRLSAEKSALMKQINEIK
jgi:hypothetical protein